jgi:hypothetical protein
LKLRGLENKAREYTEKLREELKIEKKDDVVAKLADITAKDRPSSGWVAKVDGEEISVQEFEKLYYAFHKLMANASKEEVDKYASDPGYIEKFPALNRGNFLDMLVDVRMIYLDADKNGFLKNQESKSLLQAQAETFVVRYYTLKKFEDKIEVSDDAVARIYEAQQNRFAAMPILQAENMIRNQLVQREMAMKIQSFIEGLREAAVIEKNLELLNKKPETKTE